MTTEASQARTVRTARTEETAAAPGLPRLILLHGTRLSGAQWVRMAQALADLLEVVTPDMPGHGQRGDESFSLEKVVAEVDALVDGAGSRPVILAGYSLGGYAALCYGERHPHKLAGLALIASAAEPLGVGAWLYRLMGSWWDWMSSTGCNWVERFYLAPLMERHTLAALAERGGNFCGVRAAWEDVMAHCRARQLLGVGCPVLIAGGGLDQLHIHAQRFAGAAPHAQVVTAPFRNHLWPLMHPDELVAVLRTWLKEVVLP